MELSSLQTLLKQEGTSQAGRYLPGLDPEYIKINEQSLLDHLRFAEEYSHFLVFLNASGQNAHPEKQTWKEFFSQDSTTLIARISNHDTRHEKTHYAALFNDFSRQPILTNFLKLITYTGIWASQLNSWLRLSPPASLLNRDLTLMIQSELSPRLVKLKEYYLATKIFNPAEQTFEEFFNLTGLLPVWGNLHKITSADQSVFAGDTQEEKLKNAAVYINAIFECYLHTVDKTVNACTRYLHDSLVNDATHAPHMALFLSFLQLLQTSQGQLNLLSRRHLDFYYKDFLQVPLRGPVPDQAFIQFSLAKGMYPYNLPAATPLLAGKDAGGIQQTYLTEKELLVTNARIDALKTIFITRNAQGISAVYGAPVANSSDGKGAAFKSDDTSWPVFGQVSTPLLADTGFAIASPQLLLQEGTRTIELQLTLASSVSPADIDKGVDTRLFSCYLTSTKGWISTVSTLATIAPEVILEAVTLTATTDGILMTVNLLVPSSTAKPVSGYMETIHGNHFHTLFPVLKVILHGSPDAQAEKGMIDAQLSFLKSAQVSKVHIKVGAGQILTEPADTGTQEAGHASVAPASGTPASAASASAASASAAPVTAEGIGGLSLLQAANDDGDLDTTKPFLPFTAVPSIGSSFYLNADEFCSKPIDNARIYLEWILPDNFSSYYEPYGILYSDTLFPVKVETLKDQVYQAEGSYNLFDAQSTTCSIDLMNLNTFSYFSNIPSGLPVDGTPVPLRRREGTLKLSLLKDFGHSIYPQLIVGSLMEKAGKLSLSAEDTTGLKKELDAHPLAFTQDTNMLGQLTDLVNIKGAEDTEIHAALSQALKISLVAHNLVKPPAASVAAPQAEPGQEAHALPAPVSAPGAIHAIASSFTHFFKYGSFRSADPGAVEMAVTAPAIPVNPAIAYVVQKETENHLETISQLGAARLLAERANGPVTPASVHLTINSVLAGQQASYIQKLSASTQDLLRVLSIPPPPYTPHLKSVQLAYASGRDFSDRYDTFYHILPFGVSTQQLPGQTGSTTSGQAMSLPALVPQFSAADGTKNGMEGQLLIGLSGIDPSQQVALFFQILNGSNLEFGIPPVISWSYMHRNCWQPLPAIRLIADSTYNFQNRGIVVIDLPDTMDTGTEQTQELCLLWLRASITGAAINLPRISAVLPNAVTATFADQGNAADHYLQPLPAGAVSKMAFKIPEIARVVQPVATQGGKPGELQQEYYIRLSERLRHKNRAVTNWDYEHMLLQQFPSVYKVKCLNNFFVNREILNDPGKYIPGHLSLVLIPDLRKQNASETIPLKPRVSYKTLIDAEQFFMGLAPPGVQIHAVNPAFDSIRIRCTVKFMKGLDNGSHMKLLNHDLIGFLAPWTVDTSSAISFQVKVYASSILDFIDKRPYVDYVTLFDMYCNDLSTPLAETTASTPFSILVSAPSHDISYTDN